MRIQERDTFSVIDGFFIPKIRKSTTATKSAQSAIKYSNSVTSKYIKTFSSTTVTPIKIQSKSPITPGALSETTTESSVLQTTTKISSPSVDWLQATPSKKEMFHSD